MIYVLKHKDTPVLRFSVTENTAAPAVEILWKTENTFLLPLDMAEGAEGLSRWLRGRTVPKNRAFAHSFLSRCGLSINRPMDIISVSKGLSLNDVYWVVEEGFAGRFSDYNLYENNFSNILALIAFTGYGSSLRSSLFSSPEFTTAGMLPKCWRRISGKVYLYKGGTSGASNTGFEPYSEYYASEIAKQMGVNAIEYGLTKWKGVLCSCCELFTSAGVSYIPIGKIIRTGGMKAVREFYASLGPAFTEALSEMLVFDAIIANTDRHFGNFGVLVETDTNKIIAPAPLFDHGNALFNFAGQSDLASRPAFEKYAATLLPQTYDDFIQGARELMSEKNRQQVRRLLNYKPKKHSRYNLPKERYDLMCGQVQKRAGLLLE